MGQNSRSRGTPRKKFLRTRFTKIAMWTTIRKDLDRKWCGNRVQTGNVYSCTAKRFCSWPWMWTTFKKEENENALKPMVHTMSTPPSDLVKLERTQRECKPNSCKKTMTCSNLSSQQVLSNNNLAGRDPTRTPSSGLTIWKDVRRSAWKSSVNWQAIESGT